MWAVQNIEFHPVEMDFRSSGLGRYSSTAAFADGVELANALSLLDFTRGPVQLSVCGQCGVAGCKPGDWVSIRRLGDGIVLIPSFADLEESQAGEYRPPTFISEKGVALVRGPALQALGERVPVFQDLDRWPWLTAREFARVMQWEAPARILGEFPSPPKLQSKLVVAVDPGEQEEMMSALDALLVRAFACNEPVTLGVGEPIAFYLDLPGIAEWVPLALDGENWLLANGPDFIVSFPYNG
jgi:hypothetical protein